MEHNYASQLQTFTVEEDGYFEYMPDPLILHRTARYLMDTRIVLPESATLLYGEVLMPGRKYHHRDELFGFHLFSSNITAAREPYGDPLFVERFVLEPGRMDFGKAGVMGPFEVFGNVIVLTPARHFDALRDGIMARTRRRTWPGEPRCCPTTPGCCSRCSAPPPRPSGPKFANFTLWCAAPFSARNCRRNFCGVNPCRLRAGGRIRRIS